MSIIVQEGLTDSIVLPRNAKDVARVSFRGRVGSLQEAPVFVTIFHKQAPIEGWDRREAGSAGQGAWQAEILELPTGGPYEVVLEIGEERTIVRDVLVGDLWVLAGQSNMEGCGDLRDVEPPAPYVHVFDMAHRWHIAEEPLHWLIDSPDSCHCESTGAEQRRQQIEARKTRTKGAGLGLPFAKALYRETGVPIGLIASAHGGTSMQQWNPELKHLGGASLYGSMLRQVQNAGGKVAGVLWYQGESDANANDAPHYVSRMKALVKHIRADFQNTNLPFYFVQIGRVVMPPEWNMTDPKDWNAIQEHQRLLVDAIPHTGVVSSVDLELDDLIHIGVQGLKRLGERLALLTVERSRGVRLNSVRVEGANRDRVRVSFGGLSEGGLEESLRVTGFSIRHSNGDEAPLIYKAQTDPEEATDVLLYLTAPVSKGLNLWHGWGFDSSCTLTDVEDQGIPVFGPVPLS